MKSFTQFLTEIKVTDASKQAYQMGLQSDGHGGWYNRQGEFVAKTVKGRLKFFDKRQRSGKDPEQGETEKKVPGPSKAKSGAAPVPIPAQTKKEVDSKKKSSTESGSSNKKSNQPTILNMVFGKFNPPSVGHKALLDSAAKYTGTNEGEYLIFPSRTQDNNKNPLDPETKIEYMKEVFPEHSERIVDDENIMSIFDALVWAQEEGFSSIRILCGKSRVKEFEKLAKSQNGVMYFFDNIQVLNPDSSDSDVDENGITASARMRLSAKNNNFAEFTEGLPDNYPKESARQMFDDVRSFMNVKESKIWEVSPKSDFQGLRESYVTGKIFKIGQLVENLNTGISGKIIRRGANYLICVTENDVMFKSWITDVSEKYSEHTMERKFREPKKPNTLVGTGGYRKNAEDAVPMSTKEKKIQSIKEFINNNRKSY